MHVLTFENKSTVLESFLIAKNGGEICFSYLQQTGAYRRVKLTAGAQDGGGLILLKRIE